MSSQLLELQRNLQLHVLENDGAIANAVDSTASVSAETRLKIYYDAYRLRLIECLQANFPVLARLLGEEAFSRLAQQYLNDHPSQHYSVRWFGHRLVEFLSDHPEYVDRPWLKELAQWEWSIASAFDSLDATPLGIEALAAIAPDEWGTASFVFHSSVRRLTATTNIVAIAKAAADEKTLPDPGSAGEAEWLIWRQQLIVQYRSLDTMEIAALDAAMKGENFGAICEVVANHCEPDDAPLRAASLLKRWLTDDCLIELHRDGT